MGLGTQKPTISFIVPALNEETIIEKTVTEIMGEVNGRFSNFEMILVDDGSADDTGEIMERIAAAHGAVSVIHNPTNLGLGKSYQRGVERAKFEYVMMLCGDGGLPASSLPTIFDAIGKADIVIPYMANLRAIKTPLRYFLSRTYTRILNGLFRQRLHYYNGLSVHRLDLLRKIRIKSEGFGFQAEILTKFLKSGCSYVEVEVFGSEMTFKSRAVNPKSFLSVGKMLFNLVIELIFLAPIPIDRD